MKKILFGVAALGLLGLAGAGIGLKAQDTVEAKAAGLRDIYFDFTDSRFSKVGADVNNLYLHYFGGETGSTTWGGVKWNSSVVVNEITYLKWTIPDDMTGAIFHVNGWGGNQDQTEDLGIPSAATGKNCFILTTDNKDAKQNGTWYEFNEDVDDGVYLRGVFQGADHWDSNQVAFSGSGDGPYTCAVELYAGDSVKAVKFKNGVLTEWMAFNTGDGGAEVDKGTAEFPVTVSAGDAAVSKRAKYNITIGFNNTYEGTNYWDYSFEDEATTWATEFLDSMTCDPTGLSAPTFKKVGDNWNTYATSYDALGTIAKDALFIAKGSDDGSPIEQAAKRHDVIVAHHKYAAFMENGDGSKTRAPAAAAVVTNFNTLSVNDNGLITIAIVATAATLLGVGALFIARKRHAE